MCTKAIAQLKLALQYDKKWPGATTPEASQSTADVRAPIGPVCYQ